MANLVEQLLTLATAGTMMISSALNAAAPQNDINGLLFLQNRQWRVSAAYVPALVKADVPGQLQEMRADAAAELERMFADCKEATGQQMISVSGYRSYQRQATIYSNKVDSTGSKKKADQYVARPGASEHQLGLAMDLGKKSERNLTASFGSTKAGKWCSEHCWEYGYILRYKDGWEKVTGYNSEPWHFRYVGKENAKKIHERDMPLEEYLILLRQEVLMDIVLGVVEE